MFSCGLLLHYILSVKKHPFSPADCGNKGEFQIAHETDANIMNDKMEGWDQDSLPPEATHLLKMMLESDKSKRPSAGEALDHPFFWKNRKRIDFLSAVGNQPEFEYPRAKRSSPLTAVETDLERSYGTIVRYVTWNDPGFVHMPAIYAEMTKKRKYDTCSVVELVRFIRNAYSHVSEANRPTQIREMLLVNYVFLDDFPNLVMEVYKTVTAHGWDQTREEMKSKMNK
jgi:serine/threonine-protein kinase/endoribonuclease IRE1